MHILSSTLCESVAVRLCITSLRSVVSGPWSRRSCTGDEMHRRHADATVDQN